MVVGKDSITVDTSSSDGGQMPFDPRWRIIIFRFHECERLAFEAEEAVNAVELDRIGRDQSRVQVHKSISETLAIVFALLLARVFVHVDVELVNRSPRCRRKGRPSAPNTASAQAGTGIFKPILGCACNSFEMNCESSSCGWTEDFCTAVVAAVGFFQPWSQDALNLSLRNLLGAIDAQDGGVHLTGITNSQMTQVANMLLADAALVKASPHNHFMVVSGDFNFLPIGEYPKSISNPNASTTEQHAPRPLEAQWTRVLDTLTEIQQPFETHYHAASRTLGRLSRLYVASPPWITLQLGLRGKLLADPLTCDELALSDHAPVSFDFSVKPQLPVDQRPIPRFVVDHPRFPIILDMLIKEKETDLRSLSVPLRLKMFKTLMRLAARRARDEILANTTDTISTRATLVASIARAVWHNDTRLAHILTDRCALAREHITVAGASVHLLDSAAFSSLYDSARADALEQRHRDAERERSQSSSPMTSQKNLYRQRCAMVRLKQIWSPFGKKLPILAIRLGDALIKDDNAKLHALAQSWAPTFSQIRRIDKPMAKKFADKHASRYELPSFAPPSSVAIKLFLEHVRNSAPGIDGIPYRAWLKAGHAAWLLLHHVAVWLCSGLGMLIDFNDTLMIFAPKGSENTGHLGAVREPNATRPPGLKNSDVKIISGAVYFGIKREVSKYASHLQRGFVAGRNFLDNVVDLDAWSRKYAMQFSDLNNLMPILAFTDFGAAFPSIIHKWMFIALKSSNLPIGLMNFIRGIYSSVVAVGRARADVTVLFLILSGVIQGCPLASFCFIVAFDPFLNLFDLLVVQKKMGVIRACADDVGCALVSLGVLPKVAAIFKLAKTFAGLTIKFPKSTVVPLRPWSNSLIIEVQEWLRRCLPSWLDIAVQPQAKYLGAYLGPTTKDLIWHAPVMKWKTRTSDIAASRAPPSIAASLYNIHGISTLSYVAQLTLPSRELLQQESAVLARVLHVPMNAFSLADFFSVRSWGSVHLRSTFATLVATLVRAALSTISTWQLNYELLTTTDHLPLSHLVGRHPSPTYWDTPPIAVTLRNASLGFLAHPLLGNILPALISKAKSEAAHAQGRRFKMQRFIADGLHQALYPDSVHLLLGRRLPVIAPGIFVADVDFDAIKQFIVTSLSPAWATAVMKTWANAWTTSTRMHEPCILPCLFGCDSGRDELAHYLHCVRLWHVIYLAEYNFEYDALRLWSDLFGDLGVKLLLKHPSISSAYRLVTAFLAYHTVKQQYRDEVLLLIQARNEENLRRRLKPIILAARQHAASTAKPTSLSPLSSETGPRPN